MYFGCNTVTWNTAVWDYRYVFTHILLVRADSGRGGRYVLFVIWKLRKRGKLIQQHPFKQFGSNCAQEWMIENQGDEDFAQFSDSSEFSHI